MEFPIVSSKPMKACELPLDGAAARQVDVPNQAHAPVHPLAEICSKRELYGIQHELDMLTKTPFGKPLAFAKYMEYKLAAQVGRSSGLPSSNLMLEILRGDDETVDVSDYLGKQEEQESIVEARTLLDANLKKDNMSNFV